MGRSCSAPNRPAKAEISINAFLIHTGSRLVLVDAGAGTVFPEAGKLVASLHAAGYRPRDITDVVITHIHGDHSAGLTVKGKAVFSNATVHVQQDDADFWLDAANAARHSRHAHAFAQARLDLAPYLASGRLHRLAGAGEIVPGIRALPAPRHTPGHSFYEVESEGQKLVLWGDLIHGKDAQLHRPALRSASMWTKRPQSGNARLPWRTLQQRDIWWEPRISASLVSAGSRRGMDRTTGCR